MNTLNFTNKHFSLTLDGCGRVTELINLKTGENVNDTSEDYRFIFLRAFDGEKIYPTSITKSGDILTAAFENGLTLDLKVESFDNFMTFEVVSELDRSVKGVTFANLKTVYTDKDSEYLLNAIGMSAWTNPLHKGYREPAPCVIAMADTIYETGVKGAKLGVVFSEKSDAIKYLKELTDTIDPSVGLVSKAGGAYARDWRPNYGDYAITRNLNPETFDETLALLKELNIDQYDIHQYNTTFLQGDFTFAYTENGTPEEYYEKFGKKLEEAGIDTILHTYAYYIAPESKNILSNPRWQKDLKLMSDEYTLRNKLSETDVSIDTVEDASGIDVNASSFRRTSRYVIIDNEIICIAKGTDSGLISCLRGACGTTPAAHEAGAKIYHLEGFFSMLVPNYGSDLFYHIADRTADTYNRGNFKMLYLDAIDGLAQHLPEGTDKWYWFHMFVHRIVSQCKLPPQVETSNGAPSEWNVRGRQGAWDFAGYSNVSLKRFTQNHLDTNFETMKTNMTTTLGWFNFFVDGTWEFDVKNTTWRTMFTDVLDFVGTNAVIYDMSMVYHPFNLNGVNGINSNPFHKANVLYYSGLYSKLRKSHYFTEEAKNKVKAIGGEWKIVEQDGKYYFQRRKYDFVNYGSAIGVKDTLNGDNPFEKQTPFIRIESRYSTLFEDKHTLVEFDETEVVGEDAIIKPITPTNFIKNGQIASVRVKGTGADGDAMLLSFASGVDGENDGRRDHFIDLNYEGWREYVLVDFDNADYDIDKYPFSGVGTTYMNYVTYRFLPNQEAINRLTVRTTGATGKNAMIDDVFQLMHTDAPIKNPTVKVGNQTITFICEMRGGEYLEYSPETNKAILYHNVEQTTEEVTCTGSIEVPAGSYTADFSAEALTEAPIRARLTFGFSGQEIGN
ncbi:MAG: hypothetical protein IKV53_06640 [Clostridia bacterium]|nr:hypothetical protein [Clostridia bacterium]